MTSWFCTCAVTESLKRMKARKRVRQVNTEKKLSLSLKKRTNRWAFLPGTIRLIAESVSCVSLLLVSIVLFFFDVSVSYRIYYMYHGFSVYMANIRPSHLNIGPRLSLGPISQCSGLIFAIYPSKPWYIYYIYIYSMIVTSSL